MKRSVYTIGSLIILLIAAFIFVLVLSNIPGVFRQFLMIDSIKKKKFDIGEIFYFILKIR